MAKIALDNVVYRYSKGTPYAKEVLHGLSLSIEEGKITGLIGHTGCGKSTLVQLLNGLLKPESGKVLLDGVDIWEKPKQIASVRYRVGLVFQYPEYQLFEETVRKDIAFGPTNMGLDAAEIDRRVMQAARFVGLSPALLDVSPFELSGGQKRRVAIAGVYAMEPEVLILDEPAAGLDPMGREEILGGVRTYQRERGSTVIIVSHSMEDMARYADTLVVMEQGEVKMQGSPDTVFSHAQELQTMGLNVPQITRFMARLASFGVSLPTNIYTVDQAREAVLASYGAGKGGREHA